MMKVERQTVDLSGYPDLVVVYLGMRVSKPRGLKRLLGLGPQIQRSWKEQPDGLLLHEDIVWSLIPPHVGMRQYWRDIDSSNAGRDRSRIAAGGGTSWPTRAAPGSGTRRTSCGAAWRPSTTTWSGTLAF
jgi:hypothetical protein